MTNGATLETLVDDFEQAVKDAAYSDSHPMGDPGNYYKHMERDEAHKALLAEIERLRASLTARERQLADLLAASRELDIIYGSIWDRTDGCLVLFPTSIERFENARSAVVDAMEKANA